MKLAIILFTIATIQYSHCETNWLPIRIPNIIEVVRDNLRSFGRNIRNKLSEYLGDNSTSYDPEYHDIPEIVLRKEQYQVTTPIVERFDEKISDDEEITTTSTTSTEPSISSEIPKVPIPKDTWLSEDEDPNMDLEVLKLNEDPSIHFTTPELIVSHGYPAETHTVLTSDGYFLTIHRIPNVRNKKVVPDKTVLLHHGLLGSSADWVITGPQKALAYILSDAGYDVWMANARGNTYSRSHVSLPTDTFAFWNFTFHEISQHDLPAVIDYIMDVKGWDIKINYIGHSMGTTVLFALLSTKPQYNKILRAGFALAPVAYMSEIKSPIRLLAKFANNIEYLMKLLGANEFLPQNEVIKFLSRFACEVNHYEEEICENSMFYLCGFDAKQFNRSLIPMILGHTPAGASTKTLIHYAQEIHNNGRFQQFDYGPKGNIRQYGSIQPPVYEMMKVTLPIALISAENDWLSSDVDVTHLFVQLANPIDHYIVPLKDFNHIDFLWAIDAPTLVYNKLLHLLEEGVSYYGKQSNEILPLP